MKKGVQKDYVKTKTLEEILFVFHKRESQSVPTCSETKKGFGLNWNLSFKPQDGEPNYYALIIQCNADNFSKIWELSCSMDLRIVDSEVPIEEVVKVEKKFDSSNNSVTIPDFLVLESYQENLIIPSLFVDVKIWMKELAGSPKDFVFDFKYKHKLTSDATILVGKNYKKRLHVSKSYLSLYSPVFREMFLKLEDEGKAPEIELPEDYESVLKLLNLIYPSHSLPSNWYTDIIATSPERVKTMLKMADKYKIGFATRRIEEFLTSEKNVPQCWKFHFADKYKLDMVMNHCLHEIKSVEDGSDAIECGNFPKLELSNKTKSAILERLMTFSVEGREAQGN